MNNKILPFLGTLIIAVVGVILTYFLNLNKPDVRYTLSEEIPLSFSTSSDAENENVQQLEIRNVGSAVAEKIVVKIAGDITKYKILKYISSDEVEDFIDQQSAEFVYPALPPQSGFKIIFTSTKVINPSDLNISHSIGRAVNALAVSNRSSAYITWGIFILLIGGYLIWIFNALRASSFDLRRSEIKWKKIDQALESTKPWYVTDSKWVTTHVELIRELLKEEYVQQEKIAYCASYGLLHLGKPSHFSEPDWKELNDLAISCLKDHLSKSINSYSESSILSVLRLSKPERFPKDDWDAIQTKTNEKYIERNTENLIRKANMVGLLYREKPEAVPDNTWQTIRDFCRNRYYNELILDINIKKEPRSVIEENDLDILDTNQKTKLEEVVQQISKYKDYLAIMESLLRGNEIPYEKPATLDDWEWDRIINIEGLIARTNDHSAIMKDLFNGNELPTEKPITLTDWEWNEILKFETLIAQTKVIETEKQELKQQELELIKEESEMANEQTTCSQLKSKVLKQLEYIHNVLNDPSTIERIESYDDTFSSGNWSNLKRIASILHNRKAD
jgi:hypothetical protein